jgi:hypothetical protein
VPEREPSLLISSGIDPLRKLAERSSWTRFSSSVQILAGILPENLFLARISRCNYNCDPDDARVGEPRDIHARNAAPTAQCGVILVPVGESQANVRHLIYGRFQRRQRQAVWGEILRSEREGEN